MQYMPRPGADPEIRHARQAPSRADGAHLHPMAAMHWPAPSRKQVLDIGVYGIVWPHVLDRRRGAQRGAGLPLSAAARGGLLRAGPATAATRRAPPHAIGASTSRPIASAPIPGRFQTPRARCWSLTTCARKSGRSATCRKDAEGGAGDPASCWSGEGDLSQDMGFPRQYEHPERSPPRSTRSWRSARTTIPRACGHPHVDANNNVEKLVEKGLPLADAGAPTQSFRGAAKRAARQVVGNDPHPPIGAARWVSSLPHAGEKLKLCRLWDPSPACRRGGPRWHCRRGAVKWSWHPAAGWRWNAPSQTQRRSAWTLTPEDRASHDPLWHLRADRR